VAQTTDVPGSLGTANIAKRELEAMVVARG
jgi:hypothetical protein